MKNFILKGLIISSLVASSALAGGGFVGVEGGFLKSSIKVDEDKIKDKAPYLGLKGGYDFDSFMVYTAYNYNLKSSHGIIDPEPDEEGKINWTTHKFLVGADYTPSITDSFKLSLGAYAGLGVTHIKGKGKERNVSVSESFSRSGFLYGTKFGGIYSLDEHNKIEFGAKYDQFAAKDGDNDKLKFRNLGLYLGYIYKF